MSIEVVNFIPVSVRLGKISRKYIVFWLPAKNEHTMVKLFQSGVSVSPFKTGTGGTP
jgi:hypothetical protein